MAFEQEKYNCLDCNFAIWEYPDELPIMCPSCRNDGGWIKVYGKGNNG